MSNLVQGWAWQQQVSGTDKLILIALADHADDTGHCWPGTKGIAEKCGVSRRTVVASVSRLTEAGLIVCESRHRKDGSQTSNEYFLQIHRGGAGDSPPHAVNDKGGVQETGGGGVVSFTPRTVREPSIEPSTDSSTDVTESLAKPAKKKTPIPYSEELKKTLIEVYRDVPDAGFQIDLAMDHVAAKKHKDMNLYLRNWLNRSRQGNGSASRGSNRPAVRTGPEYRGFGRDDE